MVLSFLVLTLTDESRNSGDQHVLKVTIFLLCIGRDHGNTFYIKIVKS